MLSRLVYILALFSMGCAFDNRLYFDYEVSNEERVIFLDAINEWSERSGIDIQVTRYQGAKITVDRTSDCPLMGYGDSEGIIIYSECNDDENDLRDTMQHEIGHWLGLDHAEAGSHQIMSPGAEDIFLTSRDIRRACQIHGCDPNPEEVVPLKVNSVSFKKEFRCMD